MSTFLKSLAEQRRMFLDGLDANQGDINLDIFEDFYPDQAHFVFELLQNAEDAGATDATFNLRTDGLWFEHNGARAFTESDVRAITGIHNSTKTKTSDQIGKFGIGFKSVFVYSLTPTIYSGEFSFRISRLVMPEPVDAGPSIRGKTRFWLPFNNSKKATDVAFKEVADGLDDLAETTLLFLQHIASIRWKIDGGSSGDLLRIKHSGPHVEMLKQVDGKTATSAHFLKFDEPVVGLEKQRAAVAFTLDFLPNVQAYTVEVPLSRQLRIVQANPGQVSVFFPAAKETSGLRFHLHAPFVPELSRASIKETPANKPLFDQVARLAASSLHAIRDLGLLTVDFLGVLPNPQDQLSPRYVGMRDVILAALNTQRLTPTHAKGHAPARTLLQARASLKELLDPKDLEFLVVHDGVPPSWAATATQRNSNADRLLSALEIKNWGADEFVKLLAALTSEDTRYVRRTPNGPVAAVHEPDGDLLAWLGSKLPEWHQALYAQLYAELAPVYGLHRFARCRIVRLRDGTYSTGARCFFPPDDNPNEERPPRVEPGVYTSGRSVEQQQSARKFLEEIGVRTLGEAEQVEVILAERYTREAAVPDARTHYRDLKRFIALVEKDPDNASMFEDYFIFECEGDQWCKPTDVYLDLPFVDTGLRGFYDAQGEKADVYALSAKYQDCGVVPKRIAKFAEATGARDALIPLQTNTRLHPQVSNLRADYYRPGVKWTSTAIDVDWAIEGLAEILDTNSEPLSLLIWRTMSAVGASVLTAQFRPNQQHSVRTADSSLILLLQNAAWIPQTGGPFVRPSQASRDRLPGGFAFDPGQRWLKAINWGGEIERQSEEERRKDELAKQLGFADKTGLERAKRFAALPPEEQERILADAAPPPPTELPEHEPSNPNRRHEGVVRLAKEAPVRRTETRERSVTIYRDAVKVETDEYLRAEYTKDGEQFCQLCKAPLPFKLDDGTFFFEAVELIHELSRHHHQNYLCLCPNHSAMFRHANGSKPALRDAILAATGNEVAVVLARQEASIYFTKAHLADLKAISEAESAESHSEPAVSQEAIVSQDL